MAAFTPTSPDTHPTEHLTGAVERVTFHSEETGFCVLRVKVRGHRDLVTVVGSAATITPGEYIEGQGVWVNDRTHGLQFKTQSLRVVPPSTLEGMEKYLGSGMVKGIGPHFAKKLVQAFKEDVFDVIEQTPERLTELDGIGPKRKQRVIEAWEAQKDHPGDYGLSALAWRWDRPSGADLQDLRQRGHCRRSGRIPIVWLSISMALASRRRIAWPSGWGYHGMR